MVKAYLTRPHHFQVICEPIVLKTWRKSGFWTKSRISRQPAFLLQIGKKKHLGILERNRLPWCSSKSYGWLSQRNKTKCSRLSQNISETETSTTSRSPQIDAPGNKAVGDTFGFSNNLLYPEKSVPKCRSEKWKFCLGRTIGVFQSLQLEGCVGFATTRV